MKLFDFNQLWSLYIHIRANLPQEIGHQRSSRTNGMLSLPNGHNQWSFT